MIADLWQDLRYGARMLWKSPGFTVMATLTLALGIGACTAIFSLVNVALLRALPFPDSDRLVVIWADNPARSPGLPGSPPTNADVAELRRHNESFAHITAFSASAADLADGGDPERVGAAHRGDDVEVLGRKAGLKQLHIGRHVVNDENAGSHPGLPHAAPRKWRMVSMNFPTAIGFDR